MIALLEKLDPLSSSEEMLQGANPVSPLQRQAELRQGAGTVPGLLTFDCPLVTGMCWFGLVYSVY